MGQHPVPIIISTHTSCMVLTGLIKLCELVDLKLHVNGDCVVFVYLCIYVMELILHLVKAKVVKSPWAALSLTLAFHYILILY